METGEKFWKVPFDMSERKKWLELPLPVEEFHGRIDRLCRSMIEESFDVLLIYGGGSDLANVRYLSNYDTWFGQTLIVVPNSGELTLVTNAIFHGEPLHSSIHMTWVPDVRPVVNPHSTGNPKNIAEVAADVLSERGVRTGKVGIVGHKTIPAYLMDTLRQKLSGADIAPATHLLTKLRRIKSPAEIELLRIASHITDLGLIAGMGAVRPGVTESQVAAKMYEAVVAAGADRFTYPFMVSAGPRSCMKNTRPIVKPIQYGELVVLDIGIDYGGYVTDISRNIVAGDASDRQKFLLEVTLEAEEKVIAAIEPGRPIRELQQIMYAVMERHGVLEFDYTTMGFAHGTGMELVEEPILYWGNPNPLEVGMTFYVEPMLVPHGQSRDDGTYCIEDLVVVTEKGVDVLTQAPRRTW